MFQSPARSIFISFLPGVSLTTTPVTALVSSYSRSRDGSPTTLELAHTTDFAKQDGAISRWL